VEQNWAISCLSDCPPVSPISSFLPTLRIYANGQWKQRHVWAVKTTESSREKTPWDGFLNAIWLFIIVYTLLSGACPSFATSPWSHFLAVLITFISGTTGWMLLSHALLYRGVRGFLRAQETRAFDASAMESCRRLLVEWACIVVSSTYLQLWTPFLGTLILAAGCIGCDSNLLECLVFCLMGEVYGPSGRTVQQLLEHVWVSFGSDDLMQWIPQ